MIWLFSNLKGTGLKTSHKKVLKEVFGWTSLKEQSLNILMFWGPPPQLWACPAEEAHNKQVETDCLVGISQPLKLLQCSLDVSTNTVATWQRWGGQGLATLAPLTSAAIECLVYRQPRLTLSLR